MDAALRERVRGLHRPQGTLRLRGMSWNAGEGGPSREEDLFLRGDRFVEPSAGARDVDLSGLVLLPGLCDAHLHLFHEGQRRLRVDLAGAAGREEVYRRLEDWPGQGPLVGVAWDESSWDDPRLPERAELDRRFGDRPAILVRVCGHALVANSAALALRPPETDLGDAEAGLLLEDDVLALRRKFAPDREDLLRETGVAARELAAEGLTAVTEMGAGGLPDLAGRLPADFPLRLEYYHSQDYDESGTWSDPPDGRHRALGRKFFLDGSLGGSSAALSFDYLGGGRGTLLWELATLRVRLEEVLAGGRRAALHAIGDRAVDQALDALEDLEFSTGQMRIEHLETARPEQLTRMAERGIGAGYQPNFLDRWGRAGGLYEQRLGPGYRRLFPGPGALRRAGLKPAYGTDGMPRDLWSALRAACDEQLHGDQADSPEQALAAVSRDAAALAGQSGRRGAVAPGLEADFALYARDPLAARWSERIPAEATLRAGELTWLREES